MPLKIALFASGSGSNAENIVRSFLNDSKFEFPVIISNKKDAFVHERAKNLNILSATFLREDFVNGELILNFLKEFDIDCIVLAGFLLKVPEVLINAFPDKIINIHPALLPKYGGKGMYGNHVHEAVIANKEKESGITIHFVDEVYDHGKIIFQAKCTVENSDTPDSLASKIHALEHLHFPEIVKMVLEK